MNSTKIIPVILCGGSGDRLWPLSRENMPKQFLNLLGEKSLVQNTVLRTQRILNIANNEFVYVTLADSEHELSEQLSELGSDYNAHILCEPMARNTAAAIALATIYVANIFGENAYMWILPSDHHVINEDALGQALNEAIMIAKQGYLSTFGIAPTRPDTEYGYMHFSNKISQNHSARNVDRFIEKPDSDNAQKYLNNGEYLWNSGMFVSQTKTIIEHYQHYAPNIIKAVIKNNPSVHKSISRQAYLGIESASFDTAIIEKSNKVGVVPCSIGWSDIGSWKSIWDISDKDNNGNVSQGNNIQFDTHDCMVYSENRLVATAGIRDIVVIETKDSVLVTDKYNSSSLKPMVKFLKSQGNLETKTPTNKSYAWGTTKTISKTDDYLINEITLKPGHTTPRIMHEKMFKSWVVINGKLDVVIDNYCNSVCAGDTLKIPIKTIHYATNTGDKAIKIIETQYRKNLNEENIITCLNIKHA